MATTENTSGEERHVSALRRLGTPFTCSDTPIKESMIKDLDILKEAMEPLGMKVVKTEPGTMDSGTVIFSNQEIQIVITKDRSQWMLVGSKSELEPRGLWRAFDDICEFKDALVKYIKG